MLVGLLVFAIAGCVAVDGDRITAADLARAAAEFAAAPADAPIGFTPAPGSRKVFGPGELQAIAQRFGIAGRANETVCFERAAESLTAERVLEAVLAAAPALADRVEVIDFSRAPVPKGTPEFTPAWNRDTWLGRVRYGTNRSVPVWARLKIRRSVERGQMVEVEAVSGGARVVTTATAQAAGDPGDRISVKRGDNGPTLLARVTGEGKVLIDATATGDAGRNPRMRR